MQALVEAGLIIAIVPQTEAKKEAVEQASERTERRPLANLVHNQLPVTYHLSAPFGMYFLFVTVQC
jgi:hypothetical protein